MSTKVASNTAELSRLRKEVDANTARIERLAATMVDKEDFRAFRTEMRDELTAINRTIGKLSERVGGRRGATAGRWSADPVEAAR